MTQRSSRVAARRMRVYTDARDEHSVVAYRQDPPIRATSTSVPSHHVHQSGCEN